MEIELPKTKKRSQRQALLAVRYTPLKLRSPQRLKNQEHFEVYAVSAIEIDPPKGEEPVEWMLLTTEEVLNSTQARVILRWYTRSLANRRISQNTKVWMPGGKLSP